MTRKPGPVLRTASRGLGWGVWICAAGILGSSVARAEKMSQQSFGEVALRCGPTVAPSTLAAIAETESRFQPLAINDNTTATSAAARTPPEAVDIAARLIAAGHSVDLGLMQINSANLSRMGLTLAQAFDPCMSVAAASRILAERYAGGDTAAARQAALRGTVSAYNTGDEVRGVENGYVHKVELAARNYVPAFDDARAGAKAAPTTAEAAAAMQAVRADPPAPPSWDVWGPDDHAGDAAGILTVATAPPAPQASDSGPPLLASLSQSQDED